MLFTLRDLPAILVIGFYQKFGMITTGKELATEEQKWILNRLMVLSLKS